MDYLTLGRSGLHVSRACLGAMMFGHSATAPCNEDEARRIIDGFLGDGGNFIDTANRYTGGESEEVVGRAIKAKRDEVVLATKGFMPIGEGPNDRGLGRKYLTRALEDSLRRLGLDYVDVYQCHGPDADTPIQETMATLHGFVQSGKVRYIGCSNWTGSQIVEAQWAAERIVAPRSSACSLPTRCSAGYRSGRAADLSAPGPWDHDLQPARRRGSHRQVQAGRGPASRQSFRTRWHMGWDAQRSEPRRR